MNIPDPTPPTVADLEQEVASLQAEVVQEAPKVASDTPASEHAFIFTEGSSRVYMDRSLTVHQGDVVVWPDGPPDACWVPVNNS